MSRVILFSDYLKSKDKAHILESLEYIATRDGVELNEDKQKNIISKPLNQSTVKHNETKAQSKLIKDLISKHPSLKETPEYEIYDHNRNMYTSSLFISQAFELLEEMSYTNEDYMKYISERPGVVKNDESLHGLFDQCGSADLDKYKEMLASHNGNVYRDIISLTRNDAKELGYEKQEEWKQLLQLHMQQKAELLGIPAERFCWVASFHNESYHPHVHVMSWDKEEGHVYQTQNHLNKFKSILANDIFKNEMWLAKEYKSELRDQLEKQFREKVQEINKDFSKKISPLYLHQIQDKLIGLSKLLPEFGSHYYMYQSDDVKTATKNILVSILQNKDIRPLFDQYIRSQVHLTSFYQKDSLDKYAEEFAKKIIDPGKKDRKVLHNMILKQAYEIKQEALESKLNASPYLSSLNVKIESGYVVDNKCLKTEKDQIKLVDAVIKVQILQNNSLNESLSNLTHIASEEKVLERMLDIKDKGKAITNSDIKLLCRAFHEKNLVNDLKINQHAESSEATLYPAAKLFYGLINYMSTNTVANEQKASRLQAVHREDEYLMMKAKIRHEKGGV